MIRDSSCWERFWSAPPASDWTCCAAGKFLTRSECRHAIQPAPGPVAANCPTEMDESFRNRLIRGEVQDENAWVMGGVAGHAGLFGTAGDLASFSQMMLEEGKANGSQLVQSATIREFNRAVQVPEGPSRGLGWDKPGDPSSSGRYFSPRSYGHLGYTGTSLWIDLQMALFVILLTNRIHPSRSNEAIREVRPAVHDAVVEALGLR